MDEKNLYSDIKEKEWIRLGGFGSPRWKTVLADSFQYLSIWERACYK
jgi:hypothetical protein